MAAIETHLFTHLTGNTALAALVSNRIYPDMLPQDATYPAIRYAVIDRVEVLVKPSKTTVRHVRARVQLDLYARTYSAAKQLEAALVAAVYAFDRTVNSAIVGSRVADLRDSTDDESGIAAISIDASITYNE